MKNTWDHKHLSVFLQNESFLLASPLEKRGGGNSQIVYEKGCVTTIVSFLPGPTEMIPMDTPLSSSIRFR